MSEKETKKFGVSMPPDLYEKVKQQAALQQRTVSNFITWTIMQALGEIPTGADPDDTADGSVGRKFARYSPPQREEPSNEKAFVARDQEDQADDL